MSGRAVLITGGSRGIGRAVARRFAAAGDRVAVHHRDSAALAARLLTELPGTGHAVVQADLADPAAVRTMVDEAAGLLGGLDVLVNNAGVFTPHPITDVSYEQWQAQWQVTLGVNLIGAANVTWCAIQHMTGRGAQGSGGAHGSGSARSGEGAHGSGSAHGGGSARSGRIINVSSRGAFRGEPQSPAYGASKAGLNAFGQSLAIALAPYGIAVCTVAPGFVATDMTNEHLKPPRGDEIRAQSPFGRVADPDEIAAGIFYLAAADAQWASGAILDLNGASYLRT